jgi:hypothetical protein
MALAYLDIKISATVILALEGVSMLLVVIACSIILAKVQYAALQCLCAYS